MVLATHLVTGGALGQVISNPVLAFLSGFLSHFLLDAIPHWDYHLASLQKNPSDKLDTNMVINHDFVLDLAKIFLDILIGVVLVLVFQLSLWAAIGAVLPDFLQFAYFKLKWPVLRWLQAFHVWIHAEKRLDNQPVLGPFLQILLVALVFAIISL